MVLLIDTNIVLDYLLKRQGFYDDAKCVMQMCSEEKVSGCIALHTITTIWYILRKTPDTTRRIVLKSICELLEVVGTTHEEVIDALDATEFKDFEECIQSTCAKTAGVDYIITRNISDFAHSEIPVMTPKELFEAV